MDNLVILGDWSNTSFNVKSG